MNKYLQVIIGFFKKPNSQSEITDKPAASSPNRNIAAKLLALFVAAGLWLYVMNEQNPPIESSYTVPLEIRNVQANYVVLDNLSEIRVRVRGPRALVAGVQSKDINAYVDMTNLSEGSHNINVHAVIPSSLELVETTPEMALVRLEPIITRTMPVIVDFSGALAKGLIIGKVDVQLSEATIKGPKHIADSVDRLIGTIDLTGKTTSFSLDAPLIPIGRTGLLVEGLTIAPQVTFVQIAIEPDVVKKTLEVKPVFANDLPPGINLKSISLDPAAVEVRENSNGSNLLANLEYIYTQPINLADINNDTAITVKINVPEGLTANPDSVKADLKTGKN